MHGITPKHQPELHKNIENCNEGMYDYGKCPTWHVVHVTGVITFDNVPVRCGHDHTVIRQ